MKGREIHKGSIWRNKSNLDVAVVEESLGHVIYMRVGDRKSYCQRTRFFDVYEPAPAYSMSMDTMDRVNVEMAIHINGLYNILKNDDFLRHMRKKMRRGESLTSEESNAVIKLMDNYNLKIILDRMYNVDKDTRGEYVVSLKARGINERENLQ